MLGRTNAQVAGGDEVITGTFQPNSSQTSVVLSGVKKAPITINITLYSSNPIVTMKEQVSLIMSGVFENGNIKTGVILVSGSITVTISNGINYVYDSTAQTLTLTPNSCYWMMNTSSQFYTYAYEISY